MSALEDQLADQIDYLGLPAPVREFRFAPGRRWRFDFAWPRQKLSVEVEGGIWISGRHSRGAGFQKDCEKQNEATCLGWRVLRVTAGQIHGGQAVQWIERALQCP